MDKKPVYSIFPGAPRSPTASTNSRQSIHQPPCPPPSTPLPPLPPSPSPAVAHNSFTRAPPPTSDPLTSAPPSLRPKPSPNQELADFPKSLAHQPVPPHQRPPSPPQPPPLQQTRQAPPSRESTYRLDHSNHTAHQDSAMYYPALSTSSSSSLSLSKPPVFSSASTSPAQTPPPSHLACQPRAQRPNTVYFHGGIGGAGNYRKVIRENNRAPRAYAENAEPRRRPSPTRFLSKVFGGQKGHGHGGTAGGAVMDDRVNGSEDNIKEEVSLGAAEVLRRKMIGGSRRKRGGSS